MNEKFKCSICDGVPSFRWTDTHGVAQHDPCGTPYRLYHYSDDNKRVEKGPELLVLPDYVNSLKRYWEEIKRPIPGGHSFQDASGGYEMATKEDGEKFTQWMKLNHK